MNWLRGGRVAGCPRFKVILKMRTGCDQKKDGLLMKTKGKGRERVKGVLDKCRLRK